jgi:arginase
MLKLNLIQVPYHMGQQNIGPGKAPKRYIDGGLIEHLYDKDIKLWVGIVERGGFYTDELSAIMAVNTALAQQVAEALEADRFPLVIAGNCNSALGTLTGIGDLSRIGIVWFDAHGDFNTPETSLSGWFEGMPLAVAAGRGHASLWREMGNQDHVSESHIVLVGPRDLDPPEAELLAQSDVTVLSAEDLKQKGLAEVLTPALDRLRESVDAIYLHLDMDVHDTECAPGVDFHLPGGLDREDMAQAIQLIGERFTIRAAALTSFNPDHDQDGRTLQTGLALVDAVIDSMDSESPAGS